MIPIPRFVAVLALSLACIAGAAADPFKVKDIAVDKTAASINEAMTQGRAEARLEAAHRLIERLTLPEDRAAATQPIDPAMVARLFKSYDFQEQERRTGTRYITVMTVNFDAPAVRDYFDQRSVPFVETQSGRTLIVPSVAMGLDSVAWGAVWEGKSDETALTPYVASVETWDRHPTWAEVQAETTAAGALRAVIAEAYLQNGQIYVRLSDVRSGAPESLLAIAGPFSDFGSAQTGSIATLERAWKQSSVVRTTGSTPMSLVASFQDLGQWVKIRKGMEASRLISGLRVESVSATGADLSFVYAGRPDQLAADLRSRGLALRGESAGWVIEASSLQ